jgi:hypothetical protein
MKNERVIISTAFKGKDADNAELNSRSVINAIEGFEKSIESIAKNVYGKECNISCNLKAPKKGSFELNYIFSVAGFVPMLFNSIEINQLPELMAGLYEVFIKTNGKKIESISQNNNGGINANVSGGGQVIINNPVINNYYMNGGGDAIKEINNDDNIRMNISKSISPLINNYADSVVYKNSNNEEISIITKNNCKAFNLLVEKTTEEEKEMELYVKGLSFDRKRWYFQDKKTEVNFSASIKDESFQKNILEGEAFKNGDSIVADVFIKYSDKQKTNNKYTITKVIKHIIAPTQLKIS